MVAVIVCAGVFVNDGVKMALPKLPQQASLYIGLFKVAGLIGEARIMVALGLTVAISAVLAYNAYIR